MSVLISFLNLQSFKAFLGVFAIFKHQFYTLCYLETSVYHFSCDLPSDLSGAVMVCKVRTVPQGKHNRRRKCECACSCDVYTMCGSCEPLHGSCLYSQSNISSGSRCAGLPHWPVCPVKSDELGNEKQVCVKCADLSFIPLPPEVPSQSC